jgi:pyridoxal phosphate enzyme (YggS family)
VQESLSVNEPIEPSISLNDVSIQEMATRLEAVRTQITAAARSCGRDPASIVLVGVSKFHPAAEAAAAVRLGLQDLGENRVQEMLAKQDELQQMRLQPRWHLIGTLQKNKVKAIIGRTHLIHSVDSEELLAEIDRRSLAAGLVTDVLIQVKASAEASKHGFELDDPERLLAAFHRFRLLTGIRLRGLMTMAPIVADPVDAKPYFERTANLFQQIGQEIVIDPSFDCLSMGMSHDFREAIACGATHVRIGTAIFGNRQP